MIWVSLRPDGRREEERLLRISPCSRSLVCNRVLRLLEAEEEKDSIPGQRSPQRQKGKTNLGKVVEELLHISGTRIRL